MRTILPIFLLLFAACQPASTGQKNSDDQQSDTTVTHEPRPTPATITLQSIAEVLPEGYTILSDEGGEAKVTADLNEDSLDDVAVLAAKALSEDKESAESVELFIFARDKDGKLSKLAGSGDLGTEVARYGGKNNLSLSKNVLSFHNQMMRNELEVKFRYEPKYQDVMVIGKEALFYGSGEYGPSRASINYLSGVKIYTATKWANEGEDIVDLPEERSKVSRELVPLSKVNLDTLYDDL